MYICPAGKKTIGYGHVILPSESYKMISEELATQLLRQDVKIAEDTINKVVKVPLTQNQFDSLVSLVFNWGSGNFLRSEGLEKLQLKNYLGALEEFLEVDNVRGKEMPGLHKRRLAEAKLFNTIS